MLRILLPLTAALATFRQAPEDGFMPQPPAENGTPVSGEEVPARSIIEARQRSGGAALAPMPEAVSAAGTPAPGMQAESAAAALGRRILSTAFVRAGPDGRLTVELHGGRVLVLRDVAMRPADYCGMHVQGDTSGKRFCGRYAAVAAARPGGAGPILETTDAASNPLQPTHRPIRRE